MRAIPHAIFDAGSRLPDPARSRCNLENPWFEGRISVLVRAQLARVMTD